MVETRESLAIVDDILATSGIDGIFIGPADLSIALSDGRRVDPLAQEVEHALDHAKATRPRGGQGRSPSMPAMRRGRRNSCKRGFDLVAVGSDTGMLRAGARQADQRGAHRIMKAPDPRGRNRRGSRRFNDGRRAGGP